MQLRAILLPIAATLPLTLAAPGGPSIDTNNDDPRPGFTALQELLDSACNEVTAQIDAHRPSARRRDEARVVLDAFSKGTDAYCEAAKEHINSIIYLWERDNGVSTQEEDAEDVLDRFEGA